MITWALAAMAAAKEKALSGVVITSMAETWLPLA